MYYNKKYFYEIISRFISLFSIEAFKNVVAVYHVAIVAILDMGQEMLAYGNE